MNDRRDTIVTLLTDFGTEDTYVAQMKGAALEIYPDLRFVDLTHHVPPQDIAAGAAHWRIAYRAFPPGTIHVGVVDPGVGTARRGVVVRTARYWFVAPDNGLLTLVLEQEKPQAAHVLEAPHLRRPTVSATFHGRDVFAPAAAWIARGVPIEQFGRAAGPLARLELEAPVLEPATPRPVRVLLVDRFGNVMLHAERAQLEPWLARYRVRVATPRGPIERWCATYGSAPPGEPFLLFNSADFLEIACREASAAARLGLEAGAEVELELVERAPS